METNNQNTSTVTYRALPTTSNFEQCEGFNVGGNMDVAGDVTVIIRPPQKPADIDNQPLRLSQIQDDIKGMLQRRYRDTQMPKMPWMHDWFHPLKDYYVDLTLHSKQRVREIPKNIQLEDLFKPEGRATPKRILIEGPPGYGKTTLALKLCNDWATQNKPYIAEFELVLLVQLRNLRGPLTEIISTLCKVNTADRKETLNAIENCRHQVLLILDGFDEIPIGSKKHLIPILRSQMYAQMTVIVTSRSGFFYLDDTDMTQNGEEQLQIRSTEFVGTFTYICDKRVTIRGITDLSKNKFLENYFQNMPNQEQVEQAKVALHNNFGLTFDNIGSKTTGTKTNLQILPAADLLECPLFLLLIVILVSETKIESLKTKTELYKVLFNFVVRRGLSRLGIMDEVNLFDFDILHPPTYVTTVNNFSAFALHALKENIVSFTYADFKMYCEDDLILKLGFVTRNESVDGLRSTVFYEPVHKSVLEFAAAYHLWYTFYCRCHDEELTQKLTSAKQFLLNPNVRNTSLVGTFLAGLMGNRAADLLKALTPLQETKEYHTSWFEANAATLVDCTVSDDLLSFLSSFLTPVWIIDSRRISQEFFQSPLHKALLDYGLRINVVKSIFWNCTCKLVNFPDVVNISKLVLHLNKSHDDLNKSSVICEELYCWVDTEESWYWQNLKSALGSITFRHISFHLTKEAAVFLYQLKSEITSGVLRSAQIRWIRCELYYKKRHFLEVLAWLVQREKLSGIYLTFLKAYYSDNSFLQSFKSWRCLKCFFGMCDVISDEEWSSFVMCCSKSRMLQDFMLTNFDMPVSCDLHQLCSRDHTALRIDFQQNVIISSTKQLAMTANHNVEHFRATDFLECDLDTVITTCGIKSLECSNVYYKSSTLQLLELLRYDSWPISTTLSHLYIVMDRDIFENGYFSRIGKLCNLTVLALEMDIVTVFSKEYGMEQMLFILQICTHLRRLEFWNVQYLDNNTTDIFSAIASKSSDGPLMQLETIMLQGDLNETMWGINFYELVELLTPLQEMMVANKLSELWLVNEEQHYFKNCKHDWETSLLMEKCLQTTIFSPEEGFTITKDLLGMKAEDSVWSKRGWENPFETHTNFKFYKHTFYSQQRFCIAKEADCTYL